MSLLPPKITLMSVSTLIHKWSYKIFENQEKCQTFQKADTSDKRTKSFSPMVSANLRLYCTPFTPRKVALICDVTENFIAKLCNCSSKVYDPVHYFHPLYEIYAMEKTVLTFIQTNFYTVDSPCNYSANYTRMKICTCLLVGSGNTLWVIFFHCKICVIALIC